MRALCAGLIAVVVLSSGAAYATEPTGKDKGSSASSGGSHAGSATSTGGGPVVDSNGPNRLDENDPNKKRWEVGTSVEYHHLIRQNDLEGYAVNKNLNYFYFYGQYDLTKHDRISVRGGFYERFIADAGETGLRSSDISLTYTRFFELPGKVELQAKASLSAPTSFASQKQSLITEPTVGITAERVFGDFTVDLRLYSKYFVAKYSSAEGGNTNPQAELGGFISGEYKLHFFPALTIGAELHTAYNWFYHLNSAQDPNAQRYGVVSDSMFPNQPAQQEYGGEVFVRYTIPEFLGIKTDVTASFAQGDPTLGYTSIIHDGFTHIDPFWRQTSEVYAVLSARY
jgi:hypothetical protein